MKLTWRQKYILTFMLAGVAFELLDTIHNTTIAVVLGLAISTVFVLLEAMIRIHSNMKSFESLMTAMISFGCGSSFMSLFIPDEKIGLFIIVRDIMIIFVGYIIAYIVYTKYIMKQNDRGVMTNV